MGLLQVSTLTVLQLATNLYIAPFLIDLELRPLSTPTSRRTTETEQLERACASTRMVTFKLTSAASTPTSTLSGVESGKPLGSSTRRPIHCQVASRSTITTLRMATSTLAWSKNLLALLSKTRTLTASSQPSTELKHRIRRRSRGCTKLWEMPWSAWGEPYQWLGRNSTGATQEWWWTEWVRGKNECSRLTRSSE